VQGTNDFLFYERKYRFGMTVFIVSSTLLTNFRSPQRMNLYVYVYVSEYANIFEFV